MKKQVDKSYYFTNKYVNLERFISYYYQIKLIRESRCKNILFVGIGDGVVVDYLRKNPELNITTFDIAEDLNPDILGDIKNLDLKNNNFDLVVAYEVLEHIPFENFDLILNSLSKTSNKVLISLPYRNVNFELIIKFPFIRTLFKRDYFRILLTLPIKFPGFEISGQHYWEIDNKNFKMGMIKSKINKYFNISKIQKALLSPYKCFFILNSKK